MQPLRQRFVATAQKHERRRGQAAGLPDHLGHGLIQRKGVGQDAGSGVRDGEHLQQRRHLGLARFAAKTLAYIEADVGPHLADAIQQGHVPFEREDLMPGALQGPLQASDGLHPRGASYA